MPTPTVARSAATTIAFDFTARAARQAKSRSVKCRGVRGTAGLQHPLRRVVAVRFDVVDALHQQAAADLPSLDGAMRRMQPRTLDQAQVFLCAEQIQRLGIEPGRAHDFGEDLGDLLGQRQRHLPIGGDHAAVRRHRIARVCLAMRLGDIDAQRDAAWVGVLDDGNARLGEVVRRSSGRVGVDVVVVRHRLAVQHASLREAERAMVGAVKRSTLVWVFAVAQHFAAVPAGAEPGRKPAAVVGRCVGVAQPRRDRDVVRRGVHERVDGQRLATLQGESAIAHGVEHLDVAGRRHHDRDRRVVLCRTAHHRRPADVDLLDDGVSRAAGATVSRNG